MLNRLIAQQRQEAVEAILGHYRNLYFPHAMLTPSARFALYATAKALLSPGDRVLISPITCHTVIHALLAARVTPVFVDIELATGNIDVSRLSESELRRARAIVTTNLYGNPDAVQDLRSITRSYGLLLIEDCAHVLHTRTGTQEIGSVGDISVFSFKKQFEELGGVVCARDAGAAVNIQSRIVAETTVPSVLEEQLRYCQFQLTKATNPLIVRVLSSIYRRLRTAAGRNGNNSQVAAATTERGLAFIRSLPTTATLLRVVDCLQRWRELIEARTLAAHNLIARCPLPMKNNSRADEVVYLAVPFFSADRDAIVAKLRLRTIPTYFLYTPAMNILFRDRAKVVDGFDENRIEHWSQNILPVLPQFGPQLLEVLGECAK
jgi:hypothetical protein